MNQVWYSDLLAQIIACTADRSLAPAHSNKCLLERTHRKRKKKGKKKGSTDLSRFLVYGRERRSTSHDRVFGLADKRSLSDAEESQKEERQEIEKAHLYRESTLFSSETTGRHSKPEAIAHSWVLYYTFLIRLRSRLRHSLFGLCLISYSLLFFFSSSSLPSSTFFPTGNPARLLRSLLCLFRLKNTALALECSGLL